MPEEERR
jgi:SpoVK/Ycf46/Vps4 family AAA+-type ATPase